MKIIKIGILVVALLSAVFSLYGDMVLNDTDPVFPENDRRAISELLVSGAAGFIDSNCEALLLLREFELSSNSSFSIANALLRTENALNKLEEAMKNYSEALKIGENCGYEKTYRDKLVDFNYDTCIIEEKLNSEIANAVAYYLKRGDVLGMYRKNIENIDELIGILKTIQNSLRNNEKPDIAVFWSLLQKFSMCKLFGNYATVLSTKAFENK